MKRAPRKSPIQRVTGTRNLATSMLLQVSRYAKLSKEEQREFAHVIDLASDPEMSFERLVYVENPNYPEKSELWYALQMFFNNWVKFRRAAGLPVNRKGFK